MPEKKLPIVLEIDPAEMALRGRIGAYRLHATHDPTQTTAAGRAAFLARFEREVDPDLALPAEERRRRAECAKKAYFAKLAYLSSKARRSRNRGTDGSAPARGCR